MSPASRLALPDRLAAHPASVGETYGQHGRFALRVASKLAVAATAAAVHAIYPPAFETTASDHIRELNAMVTGGPRTAPGGEVSATAD